MPSCHDRVAPYIVVPIGVGVTVIILQLVGELFFQLGFHALANVHVRKRHRNPTDRVEGVLKKQDWCHVVPIDRVDPVDLPVIGAGTIFRNIYIFVDGDI